jgi:hypothetical protein|uniref:Uncharacterized protein n=1 Tax=Picea glauca TaxID=3330 RepID=A0A101LU22_PICGL|nr:hypothetical protein ABT39_MTgene3430 [Picea glauca]
MYAMKVIASIVYRIMMFPHNGKIITIDQLTYYDPKSRLNLDHVLPTLSGNSTIPVFFDVCPGVFKNSAFLHTYHGPHPVV